MKLRSNRLVLLIGIFLAAVAFVTIVLILQQGRQPDPTTPVAPTELPTVFATRPIPLGTRITPEMVREVDHPVNQRAANAFPDDTLVIGKIARKDIPEGKQLTGDDFETVGLLTTVDCPPGQRCIAVQVDQVSGVGTIIRTGDYVDVLVGFNIEVVTIDPETGQVVAGAPEIGGTSTKLLLQGLQVVGHLLPPPPEPVEGQAPQQGTALTGQQEIVILSASAQQVEVIKYAQLDGSISLVLRSPQDFRDPTTQEPIIPVPEGTTGITLSVLVDQYGVLVPDVIGANLPSELQPSPAP